MAKFFIYAISFCVLSSAAEAYIGPGMGAGAVAAVLGVVASVIIGFFAILYYPIKRALRKRKAAQTDNTTVSDQDDA